MTRMSGQRPGARRQPLPRSARGLRWATLTGPLAEHGFPGAILIFATVWLFRTWLGGKYPGGTDSGFLYSELVFFRLHELNLFTVWLPTPFGQVSQYSLYWLLSMFVMVFRSVLVTYKLVAFSIALLSVLGCTRFHGHGAGRA